MGFIFAKGLSLFRERQAFSSDPLPGPFSILRIRVHENPFSISRQLPFSLLRILHFENSRSRESTLISENPETRVHPRKRERPILHFETAPSETRMVSHIREFHFRFSEKRKHDVGQFPHFRTSMGSRYGNPVSHQALIKIDLLSCPNLTEN